MSTREPGELRVGVVGLGWMGQVHSRALTRLLQHYPASTLRPRLVGVADTADDERTAQAVAAYGFESRTSDWRELVVSDDIDLVCVTGPNFIHRDVAVAAASAGKHLWVEKPAGRSSAETREIATAVQAAGVQAAAGFNYRNAPAVERARDLVAAGRIGTVEHTSVRFLADYAAHPDGALSWRFTRELAGSGVLGDLVSHAVDLARHVVGELAELVVDRATFIAERPQPAAGARHFERGSGAGARSRTRTTSTRCCVSPTARAACWSRIGSRWGSSAPTASPCTAPTARSAGTSAGWASCRSASTRTTRTARGRRC